ncbi:maltose alpha-D-glucosyltransferase [Nigerium massiliense]|uniref:maltose alpha-D-glucosyltransferase n=1 Tax=Nigerium massiliense TaxID=1522317 RepID=UPI0009078FF7|nr:maltose alpha-D-glucosyltransferase [Nigerium massiliense]
MTAEPDWFKTAVFYEVLVRSFADADGNGIGDLAGLTSKLDYLAWLGIDCLWLPPFFPSPLRDGGYDVEDYFDVQPELGTLDDLRTLIDEAHKRDMRVISDFVMNHTSDAHPWFEASRSDPEGPYGDYYVWRDEPTEYEDARIIFIDSEESNWTYDPVRGQYFWHRFYGHQPDLNFENPAVLADIQAAIRFWLELGFDGFRLDAVPYLIEADRTNCENLPGTHAVLKQVRAMVDEEFPGAILLCEANQWPSDVIEYFGDDDECHMAFHFPVMPRLYMGLRRGSRESISQILADTPAIPPGCQWGTFLRNHDELTLEMVTEDERQYMWHEYAPVPRMRCNLGIRRRLAPLMGNDQRRIRLLHAMLLALPGSPVLYYGDEIGMGDNIWLADRDGVRTPMQWTDAPGAGFSEAEEELFPYPVIDDEEYAPAAVNVAAQRDDPDSLLNWLQGVLALRREHLEFGLGEFSDLGGSHQMFSFARRHEDTTVLSFNNLTDEELTVEVNLSAWAGRRPEPLFGSALGTEPAEITSEPYRVTLPAYGFSWLTV